MFTNKELQYNRGVKADINWGPKNMHMKTLFEKIRGNPV